jgi:hypothetical protein
MLRSRDHCGKRHGKRLEILQPLKDGKEECPLFLVQLLFFVLTLGPTVCKLAGSPKAKSKGPERKHPQ